MIFTVSNTDTQRISRVVKRIEEQPYGSTGYNGHYETASKEPGTRIVKATDTGTSVPCKVVTQTSDNVFHNSTANDGILETLDGSSVTNGKFYRARLSYINSAGKAVYKLNGVGAGGNSSPSNFNGMVTNPNTQTIIAGSGVVVATSGGTYATGTFNFAGGNLFQIPNTFANASVFRIIAMWWVSTGVAGIFTAGWYINSNPTNFAQKQQTRDSTHKCSRVSDILYIKANPGDQIDYRFQAFGVGNYTVADFEASINFRGISTV